MVRFHGPVLAESDAEARTAQMEGWLFVYARASADGLMGYQMRCVRAAFQQLKKGRRPLVLVLYSKPQSSCGEALRLRQRTHRRLLDLSVVPKAGSL